MGNTRTLVITSDIPHQNVVSLCPSANGTIGEWQVLYNPPRGTKCDFWIVFTTSRDKDWMHCAPENTLYLAGEPPSKKVHPKKFYSQFQYVFSCNPEDPHPKVEVGAPCLNWHVGLDTSTHKYRFGHAYLSELAPPRKINKISVVCSNLRSTEGQRKRLEFLEHLKSILGDKLIHFGRGYTPIDDKLDAILPYAYHLVLENSSTPHYWTEKLSDAYLGYAFPFYLGTPNLDAYFPRSAFIEVDPDRATDAASSISKAIDEELYNARIPQVLAARDDILSTYNLFNHCINQAEEKYNEHVTSRLHKIDTHKSFRKFPKDLFYKVRRKLE